ncbi:hypothetical protein Pan110_59340 [Gimesia panareensis]|nr:hypothetical protein Pan110_59340 [Gimesia panareensis]
MGLLLLHPDLYFRDCQHCLKYIYDEETGELQKFHGEPCKRVVPAPCCNPKHPKFPGSCPKRTAEKPKVLSSKNAKTYQHWKECKAVGQFPDDDIVRQNAAIIQEIVDSVAEHKQLEMMSMMMMGKTMG